MGTVDVVHDGATLLHRNDRMEAWLPPGGHDERGELPHEAAIREGLEETGIDVRLLANDREFDTDTVRSLPGPEHLLIGDVDAHGGVVGHQHVDFYGEAADRGLYPSDDEAPASTRSLVPEASGGVAVVVSEPRMALGLSLRPGPPWTPRTGDPAV